MKRTAGFERHLENKMEELGYRQSDYVVDMSAGRPSVEMLEPGHATLRQIAERLRPEFNAVVKGDRLVFMQVRNLWMASELVRVAKGLAAGEKALATNHSFWSWEYDRSDVEATVYVNDTGYLRLEIVETDTKTGLGAGVRKVVKEDIGLGTLERPRFGMVPSLLKKHGHERSRAGYPFQRIWTTPQKEKLQLAEIVMRELTSREQVVSDPQSRKQELMDFVRSMTPEEVEKAFAAVLS